MYIGTTFSHLHTAHLGLDAEKGYENILDLELDIIRLACYWSEVEKNRGVYDFSSIKQLLDVCEKNNQKVLLTVGQKAPRWPEFYIPIWAKDLSKTDFETSLILFVTKCVAELQNYDCITHWQVENEPLDPSGPQERVVEKSLLQKEIDVVRKTDKSGRPIVVNIWGNDLKSRQLFPQIEPIADIVGLDIYYKQACGKNILGKPQYRCPDYTDRELTAIIAGSKKPVWITELQAEPWEDTVDWRESKSIKSMSPKRLQQNFERVRDMNPAAILLWGSEFWLYQAARADQSYLETVKKIIAQNKIMT